jgi:hypothetical protein
MNLTFACPQCEQPARVELSPDATELTCPECKARIAVPARAFVDERLHRCLVCPSRDVYLRKDFPQRLGVVIVVLGFAASTITWAYSWPIWTFAILFATALVDVVLYVVMPNALACYHCGAQYRGLPHSEQYSGFDLETHERHRQQKIRLAEHQPTASVGVYSAATSPEARGREPVESGRPASRD